MRSLKVLVLLTLLAAIPVLAAEEPPRAAARPLATMHITPDTVTWEPEAPGDVELAVAGPDDAVVRYEFAAGEAPTFNLFDQRGQRLPDGVYTYELRTARELRPGRSLLLSGSVEVREGSFVDRAAAQPQAKSEGGGPKPIFEDDQVISDDLIVDGNACIGDECATGDADFIAGLKLKAQEVQILFDDTAGFVNPARDWAIEINDFLGGTERFSVSDRTSFTTPFTIRGGAPDHSLYVSSSGNLGLGTSTPATRLDVRASSSGAATGRVQNSSGTGYSGFEYLDESSTVNLFLGIDNAANTTRFNSINNHPIVILTNSSERARVTSAGDVGIGTSTPSSKLHVNGGDIRVSGGSFIDDGVTLNAPDYVFEPDYELMPLAELAAFVRTEKHLPNVPKAAEIKASGLNLSHFQMRLLEKIEELTLYTLAQQEQLAAQQETIAALAAKLEELEAK